MGTGALTEYVDVAQVSLYVFWIFFAWLIFYIRRTDRREGYPLESDNPCLVGNRGGVLIPPPKEYKLPHGEASYFAPGTERDDDEIKAERMASFRGAAYVPTGASPMLDRVGPAAYAKRKDQPEKTHHGDHLIQPMRQLPAFSVADGDADPRGYEMVGADNVVAGTVKDIWIDVADHEVRYLEVEVGGKAVLTPMPLISVRKSENRAKVHAILGEQFKDVPATKNPTSITKLEEDRIGAYFAGGRLYAHPDRTEPVVRIPLYVGGDWRP